MGEITFLQLYHLLTIMTSKPLRINDKNGNVLVIVDPTMAQDTRCTLVDRLHVAYPGKFLLHGH